MLKWVIGAGSGMVVLPLLIVILTIAAAPQPADAGGTGPSSLARRDIPAEYLRWYLDAAQTCPGLPWQILAAVGKVESDHGRDPNARRPNHAGAAGPMQFLQPTFRAYAKDGNRDGHTDRYNPADAIYTAAAYLCDTGARGGKPAGIRKALYAYNHSWAYVDKVLAQARRYVTPATSAIAAKAIAYAKRQLGKPYIWGGTGPKGYDCSGLLYMAYKHAGVTIGRTTWEWRQTGPIAWNRNTHGGTLPLRQIKPGDLLYSPGSDGTPTKPGHVVMYIGNQKIIQAQQTGTNIKIDPLNRSKITIVTRPAALRHEK